MITYPQEKPKERSENKKIFLTRNSDNFYYFFFLNQPTRNKIPIRNAGGAMMRGQESIYHLIGSDVTASIMHVPLYNSPARIKTIPPTISCFQDISKTINKTSEGILCINNPRIVPQNIR